MMSDKKIEVKSSRISTIRTAKPSKVLGTSKPSTAGTPSTSKTPNVPNKPRGK